MTPGRNWSWTVYSDEERPKELAANRSADGGEAIWTSSLADAVDKFIATAEEHGEVTRMEIVPMAPRAGTNRTQLKAWVRQ